MGFPLFVARRYLLASRKQAIIFVISLISVLGVIVGVAALVVVLALMTGFQEQIQGRILGANAHLTILSGWSGDDTLHGIDGVSGNDSLKGAAGADTCEADPGDTVEGC